MIDKTVDIDINAETSQQICKSRSRLIDSFEGRIRWHVFDVAALNLSMSESGPVVGGDFTSMWCVSWRCWLSSPRLTELRVRGFMGVNDVIGLL
jgi:hypothetical protein